MEILKTTILVAYFSILTILSVYGAHRLYMLLLYFCTRRMSRSPSAAPTTARTSPCSWRSSTR